MPVSAAVSVLFEQLAVEADLLALIGEQRQENLYLEFKQKADATTGALGKGDARHFSKALSGFANADGGILLWGVETDKSEHAIGLRPISEIDRFQSSLKSSLLNATQPVVDNVVIEVVQAKALPGAGYVKCLIPASDKTPHRSMLACREYYKRTTEGFYALEHFDLDDMFGRRPVPSLFVYTRVEGGSSSGGYGGRTQDVRIELRIEPWSRVGESTVCRHTFRNLAIPSSSVRNLCGRIGRTTAVLQLAEWWVSNPRSNRLCYHPEVSFGFAVVMRRFTDREVNAGDLGFTCRFAAENTRIRQEVIQISVGDLLHAVKWNELGPE
jgi:hypothetical protein